MNRINALAKLSSHPFYAKDIRRVGTVTLVEFILANEALSHGEFETAAQRRYLDLPTKPKYWSTIEDILIAVNNVAKGAK